MNNDWERVKSAVSFREYAERHLTIKQHKAVCLFHQDTHPSMHIYADSYHCFVCGANGDIFDLYMRVNNCDKQTALIELANYTRIELTPLSGDAKAKQDKRERFYALMEDTAKLYQEWLFSEVGERALAYLTQQRGLTHETIRSSCLGYTGNGARNALCSGNLIHMGYTDQEQIDAGLAYRADNGRMTDRFRNRIIIPIRDEKGRVIGFSGRALAKDQQPRYLYNTGFEKSKFVHRMPLNDARRGLESIVIVEGSLDPISALNRGIYNIASQMGSDLSDEQLTLLCKGASKLVFCLDNDAAGEKALRALVERHMHRAADLGVSLYAMSAPHGKDPDDTFRERPDLWQAAVDAARPVVEVLIERAVSKIPMDATTAQKITVAKSLMPLLKGSNAFVSEDNVKLLAARLGYTVETVEGWMRTQVQVLPKHTHKPVVGPSLPCPEEWVLFYILNFKDYLAQGIQFLTRLGNEPEFYGVITLNDFTDDKRRALMARISMLRSEGDHNYAATLDDEFKQGPMYETLQRCEHADQTSRVLGCPPEVSYKMFLDMVLTLRINRLERDSAVYRDTDVSLWLNYRNALALLQDARDAL